MARGRPTLTQQLAKAAESGDLEKVKELAARIQEQSKDRTKSKKALPVKTKKIITEEVEVYLTDNSSAQPQSDFIVTARNPNKPQKYIDEDGTEKTLSRTIPVDTKKKKNKWTDNIVMENQDIEFDKKTHRHINPDNYQPQRRDPVKKIKVKCCRCKDIVEVWPGEVMHDNFSCDSCLVSNRPA